MLQALAQAHGERIAPGNELCLHGITQQDLADLVGASRSFVSTLINKMKRDGLLANQGRLLVLRDEEGLNKVAAREK
jgi:CRP-like cAMP-binding protein